MSNNILNYIKLIRKENRKRFINLMDIHLDNLILIKSENITKEESDNFIENIKNSGPLIIKLFQWFSNNDNLFSSLISKKLISISDLTILQDNCKKRDVDEIIKRLNKKIDNFNEEIFDKEPLGIGSISQVHKYGNNIIKILHKNIKKEIEVDINLINNIIEVSYENNINSLNILNLLNFEIFSKELLNQCNLKNEHKNMLKFNTKLNFLKFPNILYSSNNILIEEFIKGNKIYHYKNNNELFLELNTKILLIFLEMIYNMYIHSDYHYGNILITENKDLYLIDYGLVKNIKVIEKNNIIKIINLIFDNIINKKDNYDNKYIQNKFKDIIELFCEYNNYKELTKKFIDYNSNNNDDNIYKSIINFLNRESLHNQNLKVYNNVIFCIITFTSLFSNHNISNKDLIISLKTFLDNNNLNYLIE